MKKTLSMFALISILTCGAASAIADLPAVQPPFFKLKPLVTFEDAHGYYFISVKAEPQWPPDFGFGEVDIAGLPPRPPAMATIGGLEINWQKSIIDLDALTNKPAHTFRVNFRDYPGEGVFMPGEEAQAAELINGINKVNVELAKWQESATQATIVGESKSLQRLPGQPVTGTLSDYLKLGKPIVRGGTGCLSEESSRVYAGVTANLERQLIVPRGGQVTSEYMAINLKDNRPLQAANDPVYAQLADGPFGDGAAQLKPAVSMEQGAAGGLSAKSPKTAAPPTLPQDRTVAWDPEQTVVEPVELSKTAPALNKLKKAAAEYGPDVAGGIILAGGAYLTQKQMTEHSRAGRPDKAVGLGTGYTAAVMSAPAVAASCAPSATGGWTYLGCVILGTTGISSAVEDLSGRFASWYLKHEKEFQPPIPAGVKENIKHPIVALKKMFRPGQDKNRR
ncbi:MAG: hypothetical protein WC204_00045 [Elusimicrobiales bacterium]|jgi:hypothetical protein